MCETLSCRFESRSFHPPQLTSTYTGRVTITLRVLDGSKD